MGPENLWVWKHEFECDECGNQIEIEYSVSEYPVGAFNFETINVEGATTVSEFGFDFQGGPDEDDHEDREEEDEDDTSTGSEPDKHGL